MSNILDFVKEYNERGLGAFRNRELVFPTAEETRQFLSNLDEEEKAEIRAVLYKIMKELRLLENHIIEKRDRIKQKILSMNNNSSACVVYLQNQQNNKVKKG